MPSFNHLDESHLDESRLMAFYGRWSASPELVSDTEFDDIQLHLLECEECAAKARKCEERCRQPGMLMSGGANA